MKGIKKITSFLRLAWSISPSYVMLLLLNSIVGSMQIFLNIILPKYLIEELVGAKNAKMLFIWGGAIVLSNLFFSFLANTMKRVLAVRNQYMKDKINYTMGRKIMNVEYHYLEEPYYLDLKERAVFAINNQGALEGIINVLTNALKSLVTLLGVVTIMFTLSYVLVILLVLTTAASILIYAGFSKFQLKFFQQIIPTNRKYGYYFSLSEDEKIQKDIRLYQMNGMLTDRVQQYNKEINHWFQSFFNKEAVFMGGLGIINDLASALAYAYVGLRMILPRLGRLISLGSFSMYVFSAITFSKTIFGFFQQIVDLLQSLSYLDPYMEFMSLPDEQEIGKEAVLKGGIEKIEFSHVTFAYPAAAAPVLKDVSFTINKGEKISVVGLNGAGKTTLIKLLCRLYHPQEGVIRVNGIDIFSYDLESYMKSMAAVFQDFKLFAFSIEENITCDSQGKNMKKTEELIKEVGLTDKIGELPNGVATMFGKAYDKDGIEMSGGQSQKIAIARALYKDASLVILDEPTSALDPMAEAEIYENFNSLVGKKTAIYISHRMSSSVFCDKILILDGGSVSDFDTHTNLMKKTDSLYYKLFQSQAENYRIA